MDQNKENLEEDKPVIESKGEIDEQQQKELLEKKRQEQVELYKMHFQTDKEQKEEGKKRIEEEEKLEESLKKYYSARKIAMLICGAMWLFAAISLISGTMEMQIFLPMCLFALGALSGINVPIFFKKDKIKDAIIGIIVVFVCVFLAVRILFS